MCYQIPELKPLTHETLLDFQESEIIPKDEYFKEEAKFGGDVIADFDSISESSSFSRGNISENDCLPLW